MDEELYKVIYDVLISYLPSITAILTCIITFVKLIAAIKDNKASNKDINDQIAALKNTSELMAKENAQMATENRELRKTVQKVLDKTDTEI
jgi:hypothetical protein